MKTFKQIKEEIANVSSGYGVRGFGDISGTPKVGEEETENNPHIERVVQGADENNVLVDQLVKNNTYDLYDFDDDNWWAQTGAKGSALTGLGKSEIKGNKTKDVGLEFDSVKRGKFKQGIIAEEGFAGMSGTVGANHVSGLVAGLGIDDIPGDRKGEPGVHPRYQASHKLLARAKPGDVGSLKDIPVFTEEIKKGMFAGEETFILPSHVYEKALHAKQKNKNWRTYIQDEMFHPAIREFAYSKIDSPIIFEDEKTGYMYYARYGRKKQK